SARVKPPGPGPISMIEAVSSGAAARAMRRVRLRSSRKFCPSACRAPRPKRFMTSRSGGRSGVGGDADTALGERARELDRGDEACRIGDALAGDVAGRAMIGRGADEGEPQ